MEPRCNRLDIPVEIGAMFRKKQKNYPTPLTYLFRSKGQKARSRETVVCRNPSS